MKILDSGKFLADKCSITCLLPDLGQVTDEKVFNDNYLDGVEPVDMYAEKSKLI